MRRSLKPSLRGIFVSAFLIIYTFIPPALAIDEIPVVDNSQDIQQTGVSDPSFIAEQPITETPKVENKITKFNVVPSLKGIVNAQVLTDKVDYSPTDTVVITGAGYNHLTDYTLVIYSNDNPAVKFEIKITTNHKGSFSYNYQLDGTYRSQYYIEVKTIGNVTVATNSFKDSTLNGGKCVEPATGKKLECTANDVSIANVTNIQILDDGCQSPTDTVTFKAIWDVQSNSSERYDIGLYFATQGQTSAKNGVCSVSTLPNAPVPPWYNFDGDFCGDISSSSQVHPEITLTVACSDPDGNNALNLPYCTSWDNNAGGVCSSPTDAVPGTGSKCNCQDGYQVPITVPYGANIEVIKQLVPTDDSGTFNLLVDNNTKKSCTTNNGTTGKVSVGAGTSVTPGAIHTVGENTNSCGTTDLTNYNTTISCVDRGLSTFDGGAPLTSSNAGPLNVSVNKDDDVVCTITNTRKTGHLIVQKTTLPSGNQTSFSILASSSTGGTILNGTSGTITDSTDHDYQVTTGTYSVTETPITGWTETGNTCDNVVVGANETKYCEITNTKLPTLTVNKILIPSNDGGLFDLKIDGTTYATGVGNNGTTGAQIVSVGNHTFSEDGTTISNYDVTYGGDTGCNSNGTITLAAGENKTCTITNTAYGTLTIIKDAIPNGAQDFSFITSGAGLSNFSLDDDSDPTLSNTKTFNHLMPGIYGVSENSVSGWDLTNTTCNDQSLVSAINVSAGETVTCTFTNTQRGSISGFKLNDSDGLDSTTNDRTGVAGWTIELLQNSIVKTSTTTANDGSFSFTNLVPGNYQLREVFAIGGWTKIYPTGDFLDVTLTPGETDSGNNFINVKYPTLTVIKNVDSNGDGNIDTFGATNWTWDIDGSGNYPTGSTVSNKLPGTYTISEDQQANYHVTNLTCGTTDYGSVESQSVTLTSGQDLTCTFTNTRDTGTLRVVKEVINDNGGILEAKDFSFQVDTDPTISFEADGSNDLIKYAGGIDYDITEPAANGYSTSYNNCTDVVVPKNGVATCTITNDDIGPSLTLIKTVTNDNGGSAIPSNWTLTATGPTTISGAGSVASDNTFSAGTYTLSESAGPSGYSAGDWNCTGVTNIENQITLGINQSAVCTINNDDIAPTLKLIKYVENNDGGNAVSADWTLYAQGSELGFSDLGNSTTFHTVKAGITYDLSESATPIGYEASWWDCNGGEHSGNTVKLGVGQNITCTITNYDIAPTITLIKSVTNNNGGTAGANDFGLTIGGTNVASGETLIVNSNTPIALNEAGLAGYAFVSMTGDNCPRELGGTVTLNEGQNITCTITNDDIAPSLQLIKTVTNDNGGSAILTDWTLSATGTTTPISGLGGATSGSTFKTGTYTLSESTGPSGYSAGDWNCTGVANNGNQITLGLNQNAVCTINNNDIAPKLTLVKAVITDNGGTKVVSDFPLFINLIPATSGIAYTLMANVQYTASETNLSGYTPSVWGGDCTEDGKITLQPGDNKTCTITNDDQAGTLIVKKVLIKDNGGNETVTDFSFQVNGGTQTPFEADGQNNLTVNSGTYNIVEPHVDGYTTTYDNCNNVEVSNGETETCTITNNDIAPTITLTKVVINDNGGTAGVNDFSLTTGGTGVTSGQKLNVSANTPIALNETVLTGYTFVSITGDEECPNVLGGTVTLDEGEDLSCTITNNDQAPHLTLVKIVDNNYGGLAVPTDWTLTATGPTTISDEGGTVSGDTFSAGTYTLSESTGPSGYNTGDWNCIGIENDGDSITLGLGQSATCTITNSDIQPKLTVIKHVVTDNGGSAHAADFTMLVDAINPTSSSFAGDENGTVIGLDAGLYSVNENNYFGYTKAIGDNCVGTIAIGEEKTCIITNDDQPGTIIIQKDVLNGEGVGEGVYSNTTFNVSLNNDIEDTQGIRDSQENPLAVTFDGLSAGNYTVNEVVPDGFIFEGCYNGEPNSEENLNLIDESFTLGNGETLYLTCKNQLVDPVLNIAKTNNTGGADMVAGNNVLYTLTITAPTTAPEENYVLNNVQVTDLLPAGFTYISGTWTSTSSTTTDPLYTNGLGVWNLGTMTEGETITLTYMAHISDTQAPGTYENIAWAKGTSLIDTQILANANAEGGYFVSSSVKVVKTVEEGDVLGITDHVTLPNTGANTLLTITGITSMLLGFILLMLNPKKKIKMLGIAIVGILGIISLILPLKTYAAPEIIANISQPQTPTNQSSLNIVYSVQDILERNLNIQCYRTGYGAVGLPHTTNSGYCNITNDVISVDGTYEFYIVVTPETGTPVTSNKVSVVIDRVGPSPVVGYTKTTNSCVNTLSFTTANDGGQTTGIQIFRSTTLSFTADDSTFIKLIAPVTSNQAITYQDTPPTCDKPYYYGIRAIDNAGNISASIGDKVVVTTILPPVVTPTQQGTVAGTETTSNTTTPTSTNTGSTGTGTGTTTSTDTGATNTNTSDTTTPQDTSGDVKGTTTQSNNVWSWLKYVLIGIGVVALAGVVYMYVRNRNQENKIIK